jgi:hypothetical protein
MRLQAMILAFALLAGASVAYGEDAVDDSDLVVLSVEPRPAAVKPVILSLPANGVATQLPSEPTIRLSSAAPAGDMSSSSGKPEIGSEAMARRN